MNGRKKRAKLDSDSFENMVERKQERMVRARRRPNGSIWYGLGLFGIAGWAVMIPTLIGIAIGWWLDKVLNDRISWTLTFLLIGIITGCMNAWYWVNLERKQIEKKRNE